MAKMIDIEAVKPVSAYLAEPKGTAKAAILVVHEIWGLVDHVKDVADRFAEAGYIALAPELIDNAKFNSEEIANIQSSLFDPEKRNNVQTHLRELMAPVNEPDFADITIKRLSACFDYLYNLPAAYQKVAIIGFCFGGTYSFSLAVHEPRLLIALPFYGHSHHTVTELKQIKCPVRAYFGANDERLMAGLDDLTDRMKQAGVDFKAKVYQDTAHAFFNDSNPYAYNEPAAKDAWILVQTELDKVLNK